MDKSDLTLDNDAPIPVVDRRMMCENSRFFIYFDHVIDKAGFEVRDYLVVSPKHSGANLLTGVAILPMVDGEAGLANNKREGELGIREFRFSPVPILEKMILNSEVQDTFTLAAWCRYRLLQNAKTAGQNS